MNTAIEAILHQARTGTDALVLYQDAVAREGRDRPTPGEARSALFAAVESMGWALLVAPHLWTVLEEWWACGRLQDDLEKARQGRDAVLAGALNPDAWRVVEVAKEGKTYDSAEGVVMEVKVGPDVLSARGASLAKLTDSISRMETALAARRTAFERAVESYHLARLRVDGMTLEQRGRALLTHALQARQYDLARELVLLGSEKTEQVDEGFLEMVGSAIKRRFG